MKNKYILESLASDLKRVAIGKHRGSINMANRFLKEAIKRKQELEMENIEGYIKKFLNKINKNIEADDALMYSTLIQNYTQRKTS